MARILIAGCGYVGSALGELLVRDGHTVWGLRRRPLSLPSGVTEIVADLGVASSLLELPDGIEQVFYMPSPGGSDDALYRSVYVVGLQHLLEAMDKQGQSPSHFFLVSSTSVYGQQKGEWVDETSPTEPTRFAGKRLLESEKVLADGPFRGTVVRFGGIYGPRRTRLIERVRSGGAVVSRATRYTNRIHRDDCAGALRHLAKLDTPDELYLGVDSEPAEEVEVLLWLAGALGAPPPRKVRASEHPDRPSGNKRCKNDRLLASGYKFRYPTFREGYRPLIAGLS
jgi:nucleoside-diphosphate-sugar epimerase